MQSSIQTQKFSAKPPEVGMWKGAAISVRLLLLQGQTEDAYVETYGKNAQGHRLFCGQN